MDHLKEELLAEAQELYGDIFPCVGKNSLYQCFTLEENKLLFWFNVGITLAYFTGISMRTKEKANEEFLEYFRKYYSPFHGEQRDKV